MRVQAFYEHFKNLKKRYDVREKNKLNNDLKKKNKTPCPKFD